jgi:hypothetical protein
LCRLRRSSTKEDFFLLRSLSYIRTPKTILDSDFEHDPDATCFLFLSLGCRPGNGGKFSQASELNENVISFYRGRSEELLAPVGPHIFSFPHNIAFSEFIREQGWGQSWGMFVATRLSLEET